MLINKREINKKKKYYEKNHSKLHGIFGGVNGCVRPVTTYELQLQ